MQVEAAVLRSRRGPFAIETITLRDLREDEVLVRIAAAGMCHTDMLPRLGQGKMPIIVGHEGAGVVEAIGHAVHDVQVGDHVILSFDACRTCANCLTKRPAYCHTFMRRNLSGLERDSTHTAVDELGKPISARWFGQSSFASHAITTASNVVAVDRDLPLECLAPFGCGISTGAGSVLLEMRVQKGRSFAVFGAGAVGMAAIMAASSVGANPIIAVDLHQQRLNLALEVGATDVLLGDRRDLADRINKISSGGLDYALDTTGVQTVMQAAVHATRIGGTIHLVASQGEAVLLASSMLGKTISWTMMGGCIPQEFIPYLIGLWREGRFPVDRLIEVFPFSQINEAEEASSSGRVVKPVLLMKRALAQECRAAVKASSKM